MWEKYEAEGEDFVPMDRWGKDHWSTLAYAETCAVDNSGALENARLRCNSCLHRPFVYVDGLGVMHDGSAYPTRLKDGELQNHDDWSCLDDAVAAGLIEMKWRKVYRGNNRVFGFAVAQVTLTPLGLQVAAELRAYKAGGGNFASFVPKSSTAEPQPA